MKHTISVLWSCKAHETCPKASHKRETACDFKTLKQKTIGI